jgi:predicted DsbA family dithiol-disulfide isomerase
MSVVERVLELVEYTDPYCTWCWGSEPILRKINEVYRGQVKIDYKMGGLVENIDTFFDPSNQIGGRDWYKQVARHWLEASQRHGMPVDEQVFYDLKDELFSTYPASIAVKAAEFQDAVVAKLFLRRMREAAAAERVLIHRLEVQAELAEEVGLAGDKLLEDIKSGKAERAFKRDVEEARAKGITGFPTYVIRNKVGEEMLIYGYQRFEAFEAAFRQLVKNPLIAAEIEPSQDNILSFIRRYGKVAPREVAEVFELPTPSVNESLRQLLEGKKIVMKKVGNGAFYLAEKPSFVTE